VTQYDLALRIAGLRPRESPFLQPLSTDPESATIPDEDLQPIALSIAEQKQVPAQRLARQSVPDQRSSALTSRSNVFVSNSGCTSIRRPPGSTTASPQLDYCRVGDFLAANSTGTNRPAEELTYAFSSNAASSDGDPAC